MASETPATNDAPSPRRWGAVAVILSGDKFLVIQRSEHVVAPLAYCFPGGGIEAGETEEQALVREISEELGVTVRPVRRLWQSRTPWNVELAWWLAELPAEARLEPNAAEVAAVHWCCAAQMQALPGLLASNHAFLQALAAGEFSLPTRTSETGD